MPKFSGICTKISQRWLIVSLIAFAHLNIYAMRICLAIAITEMTLPSNNTKIFSHDTCANKNNYNDTHSEMKKHLNRNKYDWSEEIQGAIFSSFYCGYVFTNLCAGPIIRKLGAKHTLGFSIFCTSALTILTPICVSWGGATVLIIIRVFIGLGEGTSTPSVSQLLANWIPENERSKAAAVVFSGAPLGIIFGMFIAGVILQHSDIGWPMVFYFYGGVGLVSFLLNSAFCYSKPSDDPFIKDEELNYLRNKLKNVSGERLLIPWRQVLKSSAVWALVLHGVGYVWIYVTIISDMPKYMKSVLNFSAQDNGLLLSIPHLSMMLGGFVFGWISDNLIAKNKASITLVRKFGSTLCSLVPAIFLIVASYAGCDGILVIVLQSMGSSIMGCAFSSISVNAVDLSPNFSSSIIGLINAVSNVFGMLCPYIVGVITPNQTLSEWRLVFWIVFGVVVVTTVPFLIYGSGDVQKWNDPNFFIKETPANKLDVKEDIDLLPDKEIISNLEFEVA